LFGRLERTASVAELLPGDDAVANEGEEHEDDELDGVVEAERDGVVGADPSADNEVPGCGSTRVSRVACERLILLGTMMVLLAHVAQVAVTFASFCSRCYPT
jgi:hypothetical protein